MENVKVLSQETRMEGGILIVNRTVEESLTKQDLEREVDNCRRQQQQLINQSRQIKAQYDAWGVRLTNVQQLLAQFVEEPLETL